MGSANFPGIDTRQSQVLSVASLLPAVRASTGTKLILVPLNDQFLCGRSDFSMLNNQSFAADEICTLLSNLTELAKVRKDVTVYLISESTRETLKKLLPDARTGLVSENGCFLLHPSKSVLNLASTWQVLCPEVGDDMWRDRVLPLLHYYTQQTPGAQLEIGERCALWRFGECEREFGKWQATELQATLEKVLGHAPVSVIVSNYSLTIVPNAINVMSAVQKIYNDWNAVGSPVDLVVAVGWEDRDEKLIAHLNNETRTAVTISVGKRRSIAKYSVPSIANLIAILKEAVIP